eukprot:m.134885 g.134885  ORF g.134885 m.134885 type:complete len:330 (+) comp16929_c0_seq6:73-1062(+)
MTLPICPGSFSHPTTATCRWSTNNFVSTVTFYPQPTDLLPWRQWSIGFNQTIRCCRSCLLPLPWLCLLPSVSLTQPVVSLVVSHVHLLVDKMVAYEPSTNVPLVIAGPNMGFNGQVTHLTSMVDLMPTFLDLAGAEITPDLDGQSLVPFLNTGQSPTHPTSVISQFHGENLVMSWYMIRNGNIKYVAWGTGKEHVPQLFNLSSDPEENINLATDPKHAPLVQAMDAKLRQQVDYPSVTMDVAQYNLDMARWWTTAEPDWQGILAGTAISKKFPRNQGQLNPDWGQLWEEGPEGYWKAWWDWVDSPPTINPCPSNLTYNWPPQASSATVP